jgi:hypothetical protein
MPQHPERKITPEDPNREREKDKIIEMQDVQARNYREKTEQVANEIASGLGKIEVEVFHSESLDKALLQGYVPSVHPGKENPQIIDSTEMIREILEDDDGSDYQSHERNQHSNTKKYIAAAIGVAVVGGLGYGLYELYELLCRKAKGNPDDDVPLPKADKDNISAIYDIWSQQPDEEFWPTFSKLQDLNPPATIADHLYFCNYTAQVSPVPDDLWIWQDDDDEIAIIDKLEALYNQKVSLSALYENITQVTYQGQKLPRNVAGEVLTLTLGQILKNLPDS